MAFVIKTGGDAPDNAAGINWQYQRDNQTCGVFRAGLWRRLLLCENIGCDAKVIFLPDNQMTEMTDIAGRGINRRGKQPYQNQQHSHIAILHLIAAPIGNLGDISLRALDILRDADIIAAEDTRVARRLLSAHNISGKTIISARAQNEEAAAQKIINAMQNGKIQNAAYLSDAGTPGISDPGARLARRARAAGIVVCAIPGASALTTLLSAAGTRGTAVHFFGFAPRAKEQRRKFVLDIAALPGDIVLFESPRRVYTMCQLLADSFGGDARIVIGRELSKAHEQIVDASADNIVRAFDDGTIPQLGEFVILAESPATATAAQTPASIFDKLVRELPPRRAAALTAKITGANANDLYRKHAEK